MWRHEVRKNIKMRGVLDIKWHYSEECGICYQFPSFHSLKDAFLLVQIVLQIKVHLCISNWVLKHRLLIYIDTLSSWYLKSKSRLIISPDSCHLFGFKCYNIHNSDSVLMYSVAIARVDHSPVFNTSVKCHYTV